MIGENWPDVAIKVNCAGRSGSRQQDDGNAKATHVSDYDSDVLGSGRAQAGHEAVEMRQGNRRRKTCITCGFGGKVLSYCAGMKGTKRPAVSVGHIMQWEV